MDKGMEKKINKAFLFYAQCCVVPPEAIIMLIKSNLEKQITSTRLNSNF